MTTPTTNFAWAKPVVGADSDSWGTGINAALDAIDAQVFLYLLKTGGTVSGATTFSSTLAVTGVSTLTGGAKTGDFSQIAAVSGTFYTAIPVATIQATGGQTNGNDFDITVTTHANVAGGVYRVIFGNGGNTTAITVSAAANVTVQIDGSGNFQVKQTSGGALDINVTWTRRPI